MALLGLISCLVPARVRKWQKLRTNFSPNCKHLLLEKAK